MSRGVTVVCDAYTHLFFCRIGQARRTTLVLAKQACANACMYVCASAPRRESDYGSVQGSISCSHFTGVQHCTTHCTLVQYWVARISKLIIFFVKSSIAKLGPGNGTCCSILKQTQAHLEIRECSVQNY